MLAGVSDPRLVKRGVCPAGHKALYSDEWGGLPDKEFLGTLEPRLAALRDRLYDTAHDATQPSGSLCSEWAAKLELPAGIPIAIGEFDVLLRFHERVADYIREKKWHDSQELRELNGGGVELRLRLSGLAEVERWVLSWGGNAVVVRPRQLAASVKRAARKILRS